MASLGFLGVSYPLLAVTCIEPYWAATACPSLWEQPEQVVLGKWNLAAYRMEAICICSSGNNRWASGFFGWTTLDHLSGVFIDPSLRSLVLDPASPASPREVKVSLGRSYGDSLRRANSTARQALRLSPTLVARPKNFPKALLEIFNWLM